jgi:alkanesulfonate monooxygenase SsuD/methylene tetrahydromethanopterin reductase-like flavin-dependent oxidoreductase (luciferase family)
MPGRLQFALQLNPQHGADRAPDEVFRGLAAEVRAAAEAGFDAVSMGQHFALKEFQRVATMPGLARLAAEAGSMAVGPAVLLLPLHHPVVVAEELASLDVMTGGRAFAGFGMGYREAEFAALGVPLNERVGRFREGLEIIRRLWTDDDVSYAGRHYRLARVTCNPKPLHQLPVWLAGTSDRAVARAARLGDGWFVGPHPALEEITRQVDVFRRAWNAAGKAGRPFELPVIRETFVADTHAEAVATAAPVLERLYRDIYVQWKQNEAMADPTEFSRSFDDIAKDRFILGTPDECAATIARYREIGMSHLFVRFDWTPGVDAAAVVRSIRLFGAAVITRFRHA